IPIDSGSRLTSQRRTPPNTARQGIRGAHVSIAMAMPSVRREERFFYLGMAGAIAASVVLGFSRSVFLRPWFQDYAHAHAPAEPWFYVHGAFFLMWIPALPAPDGLMSR